MFAKFSSLLGMPLKRPLAWRPLFCFWLLAKRNASAGLSPYTRCPARYVIKASTYGADELRKVCKGLRWAVVSDTATAAI
jgi:hypothetical protein